MRSTDRQQREHVLHGFHLGWGAASILPSFEDADDEL
jgi:hypothetical protein